ncbi:MAG: hypothetical protein K8R25_09170 [Methanosarcinales archaeon]|jgi:hypothetical protein|nr:hypothetical protein [Methanosarcinales archaeon]
MTLYNIVKEWLREPEVKASILRYFWLISLMMLMLGYGIMAYIWFYK